MGQRQKEREVEYESPIRRFYFGMQSGRGTIDGLHTMATQPMT